MRHAFLLFASAALAAAAPIEFSSTPARTSLLELFTSEGCSSCPPAEAWLGQLRDDPALWRDFVPVAWHVDYWDRLGWKDRFASRDATQRQYAYSSEWNSASVYTPCFTLNGQEWRERRVPKPSSENVGVLRARFADEKLFVHFEPAQAAAYDVHAVVLAMGVASKVTRGENSGRNLRHEFVAVGPIRTAALAAAGKTQLALPLPTTSHTSEFALALWITRRGALAPVQAVGGWLTRSASSR